ncbi:MAG: hypothetical protein Q7J26_01950 [Brevundimonas sp.]|uniref:hypothetical protein n=1 Tax=Brevundimonas sp. TaxID=1871086 RepID=UPI00272615E2|nr:hypothetical protein [Brevundimonas sp.]MDO9607261.1 hypothetical protein [Brevundimonas sp.]
MTHHNIVRSEAGRPLAHIEIRTGSGRRRRAPISLVIKAHMAVAGVGIAAGLIDIAIGQPLCLVLVGTAFLVWCFWPSR